MTATVIVRHLAPHDDMASLTALIHAAYVCRAAANLCYWATHQSIEDTVERFSKGQGIIAEKNGRLVGTITVRPPDTTSEVPLFRDASTWTISQFGVLPELKGNGIGRELHHAAIAHAQLNGAKVMALDTAAPATDLIEMYRKWGYSVVGECDWRPHTNYLSVVMSLAIDQDAL